MTRLAHYPEIAPRIIFENDRNVLLAFVILFDAFDRRDLPSQGKIQNVSAFPSGAVAPDHPASTSMSANHDTIHLSLVFEEVPFPLIHRDSSFACGKAA